MKLQMSKFNHLNAFPTFRAVEVVPPERADLVLAADVPHSEVDALHRLDGLHVEADGGDGVDALVQLDLVQDRRLACKHIATSMF